MFTDTINHGPGHKFGDRGYDDGVAGPNDIALDSKRHHTRTWDKNTKHDTNILLNWNVDPRF